MAILDRVFGLDLGRFGIVPRTADGLRGIPLHVFLHEGFGHVLSNTGPLLVLGILISLRGGQKLLGASVFVIAFGGFAVWLMGRSGVHIGASSLAFGYFGYLVGRGFYERSFTSMLIAVGVAVFYGGMFFGILPSLGFVSWEGPLVRADRGSGVLQDHPRSNRVIRSGFALLLLIPSLSNMESEVTMDGWVTIVMKRFGRVASATP